MKLHLIRHTSLDIEDGICYGHSDIPLATTFTDEAKSVLTKLAQSYDMVFSSPSTRCTRLAKLINAEHYQEKSELMEMNFGDWENKKWNDINQQQLNHWMDDFVNVQAPNGENLLIMQQRVEQFISSLNKSEYKQVAIVTHAGVIRLFWAWVMDIPLENIFRLKLDYGAVFDVQLNQDKCFCNIKQI